MREIKYAVQYASSDEIFVDTKAISKDEAIKLFNDNLQNFKDRMRAGENVELYIWQDVGDEEWPNYGETLINLDSRDIVIEGNKMYKKVLIEELLYAKNGESGA